MTENPEPVDQAELDRAAERAAERREAAAAVAQAEAELAAAEGAVEAWTIRLQDARARLSRTEAD